MSNRIPTKFFGLHSHSGFSTFDGLGYPQEHIDFCVENGLDGWSLTDHGQMNGFAHAYLHAEKMHKAGKHFKFIPGCEMYVHPDLSEWSRHYTLSKEGKLPELQLEKKIVATVDGDDETTNVESEGASLTVENEDETKSSKFFDPVKRRQLVREFEARAMAQAYAVPFLHMSRNVVLSSRVQGWTISPSQMIYQDLGDLWLSPAKK